MKKRGFMRGQAAIEFLVTYGWAIIAALTVIAALTYFGVSNPASSLPDKCIFSNNFECKDYYMTPTELKLRINNINSYSVFEPGMNLPDSGIICTQFSGEWAPDEVREFTCTITSLGYVQKEKIKIKANMNYTKTVSGYPQLSLGEVYATVQ